ncbi:PepSY domain-containing protein [Flavobacterium terrigena]|uniref:PepSY-associated TM region n=1 Tax=Flavobacterium terrigena TaxID=402734 RepID=A0A1H6YDE7_9FLAO|nr:PepSY domain-containing protein [Flavobacterium terrigena]SEJ35210.1 PepSY-associated TM region [Flavobacterium terrigena]
MKAKDSKLKKRLKQNIYKYHKYLAFFTIVPVIFWSLSGIMHPMMSHFFKPEIAKEYLENQKIDTSKINFTLKEVLIKNKEKSIKNFRIVSFKNQQFYQVINSKNEALYFNTSTANLLKNGDNLYAEWLSKYFLNDSISNVSSNIVLTEFDNQYKYINRYLPVHKISFNRNDAMEIYIETSSSKLATFNPKSRQVFIWFFDTFHNFSFIEKISNEYVRIIVVGISLFTILCSAISGLIIYGLFWKQFKKINATTSELKTRKNHRKLGLLFSFFTFAFVLSGLFHIIKKWEPNTITKLVYEPIFETKSIDFDIKELPLNWNEEINFGLVNFNNETYLRNSIKKNEKVEKSDSKDFKSKPKPNYIISFYKINQLNKSEDLDLKYAQFLVEELNKKHQFLDKNLLVESNQKEVAVLNDFDKKEYGFVNKRLPVIKIAYNTPENNTFFIETNTSRIAAKVNNYDRAEGYTFALLHKFLYLEWAGKPIRDFVTVLTALSILVISVFGLLILKKKVTTNRKA